MSNGVDTEQSLQDEQESADDELTYRAAMIAYRLMFDELKLALRDIYPDVPIDKIARYHAALDGAFSARVVLDRAQFDRIARLVAREQRATFDRIAELEQTISGKIDTLGATIGTLSTEGKSREQKIDRLLERILPDALDRLQARVRAASE